ncbi:hypothetical protein [Mycobacteroides abscessus]|uniref:hypothetical protein n=1 Tax=Mycobacteroides abscessus TaxID=36809 RepID=UPI00355C8FDD
MRSVGTLIFERPRPLSRQRRANHLYTLICEEPLYDECLSALSNKEPFHLVNNSPVATVCGDVIFTVESTVKWSYRSLVDYDHRITRAAHSIVSCEATEK